LGFFVALKFYFYVLKSRLVIAILVMGVFSDLHYSQYKNSPMSFAESYKSAGFENGDGQSPF